jgi:MoxR-like ATPase
MLEPLKHLIHSGYPIIAVETRDEEQAVSLVRKAADQLSLPLYEWSITAGLARTRPTAGETDVKPGKPDAAFEHLVTSQAGLQLYLFKDLGPHCKDATVARRLRDLHVRGRDHIILIDAEPLPETVRRLAVPLKLALPSAEELAAVVRDTFKRVRSTSLYEVKATITNNDLEQMVQTLRGLTANEAARVVASAIYDDFVLSAADVPRLVEAKRNMLQSAGCLESIGVDFSVGEIGGLANLKRWLEKRRGGLGAKAREFGLDPPRGMLLLGVQGCGKSLCAKVVAADWNMPLLRMDPGVLYQKYIGESENRLREALAQAEAMAPAVLWIDEIEKAFASAGAESADGGLSQRMFGTLLSWMQDHRSPIFMVATANNIDALPPELMRKGRFDEVFFVDLPQPAARAQILGIHLRRRKRDPARFALDDLARRADGFSGAELEQLVVSALDAAFAAGAELSDAHLRTEAEATRPLSVLMAERIGALRDWAEGRCVPAD